MKLLVTGSTGFIGTALLTRVAGNEPTLSVRAAVRREGASLPSDVERVTVGDIGPDTNWRQALGGVDAIVHLAARVHVMRESAADPLAEFRRVNVAGTLHLARRAAAAGVKRFVYLSSVKVNGEGTDGLAYRETDVPAPEDPYGASKHEAEMGLWALRDIAATRAMQVAIVRPPLVYGPGVRANFRALMRAVARGLPLPLGAVHNRRSLVGVANLVDFILTCVRHPAAGNETFLVSDGEDLSTPDLIRRLARAMGGGRSPRLIPVPVPILLTGATLLGKRSVAKRLLGSLQVDISKARTLLNWTPPVSVDDGLQQAVASLPGVSGSW